MPSSQSFLSSMASESPFPSSLPLGSGFQFSVKSTLAQNLGGGSVGQVGQVGQVVQSVSSGVGKEKVVESLASLLATSSVQVSSGGLFTLTPSLTTSASSSSPDRVPTTTPTTTVSLSFYSPPATVAVSSSEHTLHLSTLGTLISDSISPPLAPERGTEEGRARKSSEQDSSYDALPDFEPIVSLPALKELSTGEENERELFAHRAKLYRFDSQTSAWKERGIGDIKILEHKTNGKMRVIMRRDQILKLCCNHYITAEMTLTPVQGNNQFAWYTHCDFSDGEAKPEKLAVRFKQASVATEFKSVFEGCVERVKDQGKKKPSEDTSSQISSPATESSLREKFSAPEGSWECDTCLVQNKASDVKCVACGSGKPGAEETDTSSSAASLAAKFGGPPVPFPFGGDSSGTTKEGAGGFKLEMPLFGAPVSFGGSTEHPGGGFKMGGLSLASLSKPQAPGEGDATERPELQPLGHSVSGASVNSGGFNPSRPLFSSATTTSTAGFTFSFGGSTTEAAKSVAGTSGSSSVFAGLSFASGTSSAQPAPTQPSTTTYKAPFFTSSAGGAKTTSPSFSVMMGAGRVEGGSDTAKEKQEGAQRLEPQSLVQAKDGGKPTLDFSSLFKTTATSSTPKPFEFSLSLEPPKLASPTEKEKDATQESPSHDTSAHEPDIHFEPIVSLPEAVDLTSGEENEEAMFAERAKLYRFDSSLKQWKERGLGEMKILVNRETDKARLLMRRDQVLKICCNHLITKEMTLEPMQGSTKAWTWFTPCDFSEESEKPESFAVRFKSPAIAAGFKAAFEDASSTIRSAAKVLSSDTPSAPTEEEEEEEEGGEERGSEPEESSTVKMAGKPSTDLARMFAPIPGTWDCEGCYVTNRGEDAKCCACGQPRAGGAQPASLTLTSTLPQGIKFGTRLNISLTSAASSQPLVDRDHSEPHTPESSPSLSRSPTPVASKTEPQTIDSGDEDDVVVVGVDLPSEDKVKYAESLLLPASFYNYETQRPCPGCRGCIDQLTGPYHSPSSKVEADERDREGVEEREEVEQKREAGESEKLPFAGSRGKEFSFSSLAASTGADSSSGEWWGKKTGFSGFTGAGTQLFAPKPASSEEDPEREADINFRPVVTLEAVETRTGEEEEECLFSHRAKLYRFDSVQWKERGVGEMKILRNNATQRSRIVMRREQIFKICCNHFITPELSLEPNISGRNAWTWKTSSDFAEETVREETFSVRFKLKETAEQFRKVFQSCQTEYSAANVVTQDERSDALTPPHVSTLAEDTTVPEANDEPKSEGPTPQPQPPPTEQEVDEQKQAQPPPAEGADEQEQSQSPPPTEEVDEQEEAQPPPAEVEEQAQPPPAEVEEQAQSPPPTEEVDEQEQAQPPPAEVEEQAQPPPPREEVDEQEQAQPPPAEEVDEQEVEEGEGSEDPQTPANSPLRSPEKNIESQINPQADDAAATKAGGEEGGKTTETESEEPCEQVPPSSATPQLSFADLAKSGTGFLASVEGDKPFQFSHVGKQLFSSTQEEQDNPEKESDIHFQPVVKLPEAVKVKSWDDDADALFSQRCKFYRFDSESKWKERGQGDLKILKHRETGMVKLLMRRSQTLKICCNHSLTPDMKVITLANNDKACTWFTNADFADEEVTAEKLCAKFKTVEAAKEFMAMFESCRGELGAEGEGTEGSGGANGEDDQGAGGEGSEGANGEDGEDDHGEN